jgi:NADPH:quinone reductase-like Zn-dependent oxidoreductase
MHAAVVSSFGQPPRYETVDPPHAAADDEVVIDVLAAGLHPRVRSGASGSHYTSTDQLPFIPGIDGVGRLPDGQRVYFTTLDSAHGTMAEQAVARRSWCVPLPDEADDVTVAAGINPAMSSWVPLHHRVHLQPGQRVLVLGATGTAGRMAVQIAKRLGAGWVAGAGRDPGRLSALGQFGADAVVPLTAGPAEVADAVRAAAADTDLVIDYLWGQPAEAILPAVLRARSDPGHPLTWLHIGAVAGPAMSLPSAALRAHNLTILGSGQGALPVPDFFAEIPALIDELVKGTIAVDAYQAPLADVEEAWGVGYRGDKRIVLCP